jgi:serine phosphatase RsbU (regulator of sigma subunit)
LPFGDTFAGKTIFEIRRHSILRQQPHFSNSTPSSARHDLGLPLLRNLLLKSKILIAIFSIIFIVQLLVLFNFDFKTLFPGNTKPPPSFYFGPLMLFVALAAEIGSFIYFRKKEAKALSVSMPVIYILTLIEISFPTFMLLFASHAFVMTHPEFATALATSPPLMMYLILIVLCSLLLDFRLCLFAGLVAGIEYFCLARWLLALDPDHAVIDQLNVNIRALLIVITGIVSGFVSHRIRISVIDSLESKNKLIHELDSMVHVKTKEIREQKEQLQEKNNEILDSISYARRLQQAILPAEKTVRSYFPESFILYKPKDIVAGDFYFCEAAGNRVFLAAADCTGHGVPGALVSMVCSNALNRAVKEFAVAEPGKILDKVTELVLETFAKSESGVNDGMDISLIAVENPGANIRVSETSKVTWAGAHNSLLIIRNASLLEYPADKQPVGKFENAHAFKTHSVEIKSGDVIYLLTDGYADQFGGPKGKKFMTKQLKDLLLKIHQLPMEEQQAELDTTFGKWRGDIVQVDDVLLIGIKIR